MDMTDAGRRTTGRWLLILALVGGLVVVDQEAALGSAPDSPGSGVVPGSTEGDYVHISNSGGFRAVSAHGWWRYSKATDLRADVTIQLQANIDGVWVDMGRPGVERVRPATGGSVYRASARFPCANRNMTEWRSVVDVDIVGVIDTPEKLYTTVRLIDCGV